ALDRPVTLAYILDRPGRRMPGKLDCIKGHAGDLHGREHAPQRPHPTTPDEPCDQPRPRIRRVARWHRAAGLARVLFPDCRLLLGLAGELQEERAARAPLFGLRYDAIEIGRTQLFLATFKLVHVLPDIRS